MDTSVHSGGTWPANGMIYVLGMRLQFRGEELIEQLTKLNLPHQIFWGLDGRDNDIYTSADQVQAERILGRKLTAGEVGCAASHRAIIMDAAVANYNHILVLEDDVLLLKSPFDSPPPLSFEMAAPTLTQFLWDPNYALPAPFGRTPRDERASYRTWTTPTWTRSYLLNRSALAALSEAWRDRAIGHTADFPPFYFDIVQFWLAPQDFVFSSELPSTVEGRPTRHRAGASRVILRAARLVANPAGYASRSALIRHVVGRAFAARLHRRCEGLMAQSCERSY